MSAHTAQEASMEDILASIRKIISEDSKELLTDDPQDENQKPSTDNPAKLTTATLPPVLTERREILEDSYVSGPSAEPLLAQKPVVADDDSTVEKTAYETPEESKVAIPGFMEKLTGQQEENREDPGKIATGHTQTPLHPAIAIATDYSKAPVTAPVSNENSVSGNSEKPVFSNSSNAPSTGYAGDALISPDAVERREEEERRNHPLRRGADQETQEFRNALMSPQTDDAVASAFEQLKNSATDNLDGKVEALLRPMLREWLDNNLPSMVERLVRDEIERVSRGE
ncbi:MAG: DUF2497 domain-containing protein [Rhizobiaceae bacterium]|nr:DUF2497 domain-containing protein [Rhizobiaceae bacterium]